MFQQASARNCLLFAWLEFVQGFLLVPSGLSEKTSSRNTSLWYLHVSSFFACPEKAGLLVHRVLQRAVIRKGLACRSTSHYGMQQTSGSIIQTGWYLNIDHLHLYLPCSLKASTSEASLLSLKLFVFPNGTGWALSRGAAICNIHFPLLASYGSFQRFLELNQSNSRSKSAKRYIQC